MKSIFVLFLFLFHLNSMAQKDQLLIYKDNSDYTVYTAMHKIINGNNQISYLSFFPRLKTIHSKDTLETQTNLNCPYLFEANIPLEYTVAQGRNGSYHLRQSSKVSFYFNPTFRMLNDGNSNPIIPGNYKVGLRFFYILPVFSNALPESLDSCHIKYNSENWYEADTRLNFLYLNGNVGHFSNGQSEASIMGNNNYNNYLNGNFSTNHFNFLLNFSTYTGSDYPYSRHFEWTSGLGWQKDMAFGGPFGFDQNQYKRYGRDRLLLNSQIRWASYSNNLNTINNRVPDSCGFATMCRTYRSNPPRLHRLRIEMEYICGNLVGINFTNNHKKYRLNTHLYYQLSLPRWRTVCFVYHGYLGRDYLNIRYDSAILINMLGFSFTIPNFLPPRFSTANHAVLVN